MTEDEITEFNRSKIYENLSYAKEPGNYHSKLPWLVQNQIAATNGIHYIDRIGKLNNYPVFSLPVPDVTGNKLMLDIGAGWGRWLIAGANKGYIPVGVDIRLEFCETQQKTLKAFGKKGYSVVGDLENLPFMNSVFDLVWSFSVIQHTHYDRLINCLQCIDAVLTEDGYTFLEFPNKNGIRNKRKGVIAEEPFKDDYNSWCVRYYTIKEYKMLFEKYLNDFSFENHSFLGIGVLKEDLKYVSLKNKIMCLGSLLLSSMTKVIPALTNISDSIYIKAHKKSKMIRSGLPPAFFTGQQSKPFDNLDITPLLKCPRYGTALTLSTDRKRLVSADNGIYYPVINDIPILVRSEAKNI